MSDLLRRAIEGDHGALARCISILENRSPGYDQILDFAYSNFGDARILGIMGAMGVGKSTLIAELAKHYRDRYSMGILAVDVSSRISGGALLGDRVRMGGLDGVFIRSMATRGCDLGFSRAALDAICLMDACGIQLIMLESIGLGQDQTWIDQICQTCILVLTPASGDEIQALKAGVMEIADIFAINKSDLGGADKLELALRNYIKPRNGWEPPIIKISALKSQGMDELVDSIQEHWKLAPDIKKSILKLKLELELREKLEEELKRAMNSREMEDLIQDLMRSKINPSQAILRALELI